MPVFRIYETPTPFNSVDVAAVNYAQIADVVYFAHQNYAPGKLIRYAHTNWVWSNVTFSPVTPIPQGLAGTVTNPNQDSANAGNAYFPEPASYVVTAVDYGTGQESRVSNTWSGTNDLTLKRNFNKLTWTVIPAYPATGGWSSAAGGYYRVYKAQNSGFYGYIGSTLQATFTDDNIDADLSSGPTTAYNPFPGAGDYPGTVRFHEQRSWWGNTINHPNALYASRSADFENMDYRQPGQADDSIAIGIVSDKVNVVNQMVSTKQGLLALTSTAIFSVTGSNGTGSAITATPPPMATNEVTRGVSPLQAIQVDAATLYQTVKTGEIRALGYEFAIDGLKTDDVSIFSRHLFDNHTVISWCWLEKPHSAILAVRDDGVMIVLTWDQAQQVWGWTTWTTNGSYLGVTAITEQGEDRAYAVVSRPTGVFIERFTSELWTDPVDACYLDCAKSYYGLDNNYPTTFERLDHLNGQTVYAWVDGALISADLNGNPLIVANGEVTLPQGGNVVHIGLPFTAEIETLPLAMQTKAGWNIARPQEGTHAVIKVVNTRNIQVGPNSANAFEIPTRQYEAMGSPNALFTGNLQVDLAAVSGDEVTVYIKSDVPAPMQIVGVLVEPMVGNLS